MKSRILLLAVFTLSAIGCIESKGSTNSTHANYSYDFTENGCPTGRQSSSTKLGICEKLADHTLNKHCAYGLRAEMFRQQDCMSELGNRPRAASTPDTVVTKKDESEVKFHISEVIDRGMTYRSYTYMVKSNSCSTGEHSASDKSSLCDKLSNEGLNNNCGRNERLRLYSINGCN